ncbi:hypothetical protein ACP4OV_015926 [Aristida adscensionis]
MGMPGRKRGMVLGFLGFTSSAETPEAARCSEAAAAAASGAARRVRPSGSDDDERRRWWYAERDIDRRAAEFIDRVHRGMLAAAALTPTPSTCRPAPPQHARAVRPVLVRVYECVPMPTVPTYATQAAAQRTCTVGAWPAVNDTAAWLLIGL